MQFIPDGPDIPNALIQAHEEGRVVFFCGAGISSPAGLLGFDGLVNQIYQRVGTTLYPAELSAFERGQFDTTLNLLERRLPGGRREVRQALAKSLEPKLRRKGATDTHAALLQLAHSREGTLRLVTTNFDHVFHAAAKRAKQHLRHYAAPMLPIPKKSQWNGLVHLHGLLPRQEDAAALNNLVVTSGDFGLAYLTERWAARFVSELFRNYFVCFVGYGINDPVLRYMMDALAADRMMGEVTPQAWALGGYKPGNEEIETVGWKAKGVTPILYDDSHNHAALHSTLHKWAEIYRDGIFGKEYIVVSHAHAHPSTSTQQDDFVGRMLWALSDKSGLPMKRFAEVNPTPVLEWFLDVFSQERYQHCALSHFGVPPHSEFDAKLRFSLVHRPAPYSLTPAMALISNGITETDWDAVMFELARWLVRHLNDPRLILWASNHGGRLHKRLAGLIEHELNRFFSLERTGNTAELDAVRCDAPNAIPEPEMRTLWRLLIGGHVQFISQDLGLYYWKERLQRYGLTTTLRFELRALLAPKVMLKKAFHWFEETPDTDTPRPRKLVNWELVLASTHVDSALKINDKNWDPNLSLPLLLDDVQQLLRDAMDLSRELGDADDNHDQSLWIIPSISPHWQNRGFRDWTILIELLRDAWLAMLDTDAMHATQIAQAWFDIPYPIFKRLALFAASQKGSILAEQWVDWLLADDAWCLWAVATQREVCQLLMLQGHNLTQPVQNRLEAVILNGPPRTILRDDLEPDSWQYRIERSSWLRLIKLQESGSTLSVAAAGRLNELLQAHPRWQLEPHEREEFSIWMSGTGDPDYEEKKEVDITPRKWRELAEWLKKPPREDHPFYQDTWRESCSKNMCNSLYTLSYLAQENTWPEARWRTALQVWSDEKLTLRSWRYAAPIVQGMPDAVLQNIAHSVAWWLRAVARTLKPDNKYDSILLSMCSRMLSLSSETAAAPEQENKLGTAILNVAINHPIGLLTEALLYLWFTKELHDNDGLSSEVQPIFTMLCDVGIQKYKYSRIVLSQYLTTFFRVDCSWTKEYLLPLFDWATNPKEAKAAWTGFLYSPRLYQPMLLALKSQFLETARHYTVLGDAAQQYPALLTYAALELIEGYTVEDFRQTIASLPPEGLEKVATTLAQALENTAERAEYWKNRIQPFWKHIWPKDRNLATQRIAVSLARLSIAAGAEFPVALTMIKDWLLPIKNPYYTIYILHESGLCSQFPSEVLHFLRCITKMQDFTYTQRGIPDRLQQCLEAIKVANPALADVRLHPAH